MKKIYLLLLFCCFAFAVSAQDIYQPTGTLTFTGGQSYCRDATSNPLVFTYATCHSGTGPVTGAICTISWYYNTTNTTALGTATLVSTSPIFLCPATVSATQSINPPTSTVGNYYYFCVLSWTSGTAGCPGGVSGSITSTTTQLVSVNTPLAPNTPASPVNVCVGSSVTLSNATGGGAWTSTTPGTAAVGASSGVVTGVSVGAAIVSYSFGGCYTTSFITVNDTPSTIMPHGNPLPICIGTPTALTSASSGGTWTSSVPTIAPIDFGTGIVTGMAIGTSRITYTNTSTGCYVTEVVAVISNPAPISGPSVVCMGSSITLTDVTVPGTWTSSASGYASVNAATGLVTGNFGGTATITYTASSGCFATKTVTVGFPPNPITGTTNVVCAGGSTITYADGTPGGTWSSGNTGVASVGTSGIVTGVGSGNTTIFYTTPGCVPAQRAVSVNALPSPISGILSACNGLTTSLGNSVTGGQWISSDTSVARIDTFSGILTGRAMGTTVVTYRIGTGCNVTAVVTVNPLAPIVGSDTICVGSNTLLTDIVGGGTWASSNPAIATIGTTSGIVTGLVDGITFVIYTLPTACSTSLFLRVLPPLPAIAGLQEVCSGSVVTLSNTASGGTWSTDNAFVADIDDTTGVLSGMFPDTAVITYSVYGCTTKTIVTVDPLPNAIITHDWTTHTISVQNYFASYQWYDTTHGVLAGATNYSLVIPRVDDYYRVVVTDTNGCMKSTPWYFRNYTGIAGVAAESVNVYPNPATNTLFIDAPVALRAVISDIRGRSLIDQDKTKELNISKLVPGMYILSLLDENGDVVTVKKITKQ